MQYFVRENIDKRAMLIAEDGHALSVFDSVDEAVATCIVECRVAPLWIEWSEAAAVECIDNDCVQQALSRHCRQH